jgi:dTDP-4-dehydrorhamnose 3,5-epimerase
MKLTPAAEKICTNQDYQKPPLPKGVKIVEIKRFTGEDGAFNELVRLDSQGKVVIPKELRGFSVRQINHSLIVPAAIKAWHLHFKQDEIWFIHPDSALIIGLLDVRQKSKTKNLKVRLALGRGKAHLVYIPRGIAHGLANPYQEPATMTYLVNNHFDPLDEKRLPAEFGVEEDFWQLKKG